MSKPGLGVVLVGEPVDLNHWTFQLKEAFDPWVEVHDGETILRSASLDELTSAREVRDRVTALIERLNGALALSKRTKPLQFGSVVQFASNGGLNRFLSPDAATFELVGQDVDVIITFTGLDGEPQPSQAQRWAAIAENDELLDDALIYFGRLGASARNPEATDWFDVYKALECLLLRFGGEAAFLKLNWAPDIARLKRTANWARHARRKYPQPTNPMDFKDARTLLGNLITTCFLRSVQPPLIYRLSSMNDNRGNVT